MAEVPARLNTAEQSDTVSEGDVKRRRMRVGGTEGQRLFLGIPGKIFPDSETK